MTSPCSDCIRGCCRKYLVTVTGYDMWVIANGLNLAPEQFIIAVPQKIPTGRGFLLDPSSRATYDIALDKQRVEVVRGPQGPSPKGTRAPLIDKPCVFWIELDGGVGRCGIYPLRPYVCQTYPGTFVDSTQVVRREDVLCPDDAWRDGTLQHPIWRERVLRMFVEHDIYGLAASRWNYHVQNARVPERINLPGYYAFLMSYYRRLEPVRTSLTPSEWLDMCEQWCECLREGRTPIEHDYDRMKPWTAIMNRICAIASDFFPDDLPQLEPAGRSVLGPPLSEPGMPPIASLISDSTRQEA